MARTGRRRDRRWMHKYRVYRHPRGHRHVAQIKCRSFGTVPSVDVDVYEQHWSWFLWRGPYTAAPAIPNYPSATNFGMGLDQNPLFAIICQSGFYTEMKVRAMKLKLWVYRPGAGSGGGAGIAYSPQEGPRGRGLYIVYHDIGSFPPGVGTTARTPFGPKGSLQVAQAAYPSCRLKTAPDFHGSEPCHTHYVTLPESNATPWVLGALPALSEPPSDLDNTSIHINMQDFNYATAQLINHFWYELTYYCEFFGKETPIIN